MKECKCAKREINNVEQDTFVAMYLAGRGLVFMQDRSYRKSLKLAREAYEEYLCILEESK